MNTHIPIQSAFISVFHKQGLDSLVEFLISQKVTLYSTGGTASYLQGLGAEVIEISDITGYPSILGGRVKTLHPKVHGGILARRSHPQDQEELKKYDIPTIDLVVVDLYPFEETVAAQASEEEVIEKIDIGGIALIRGAAKNFEDVVIIPSQKYYQSLIDILRAQNGATSLDQRRNYAKAAFDVSSHYDASIFQYFAGGDDINDFKLSHSTHTPLRYGENPHQQAAFFGNLSDMLEPLHGKALSYNNLTDIDGAIQLVHEFSQPAVAIIKHTNPCGCAIAEDLRTAWDLALAGDPISAFGGVIATNRPIDLATAEEIHKLFYEVLIAPDFEPEALALLKNKDRIIIKQKKILPPAYNYKRVLNGTLVQTPDTLHIHPDNFSVPTSRKPSASEIRDIVFGEILVKHLKSNAIAIVKNQQLIGGGMGQTSRIDAIHHAVQKTRSFGFDLSGAVLISDAFFPFSDSVSFAFAQGIEVIVQPGGSKKDGDTLHFCEENKMCLVLTGIRHFKH